MAFEDLEVWKRSAKLSADIYEMLQELKDYGYKDQITRSGLSIPRRLSDLGLIYCGKVIFARSPDHFR